MPLIRQIAFNFFGLQQVLVYLLQKEARKDFIIYVRKTRSYSSLKNWKHSWLYSTNILLFYFAFSNAFNMQYIRKLINNKCNGIKTKRFLNGAPT